MRVDILETELFSRYFSDVIGKNDLLPVNGVSTDSRDIKKGDLFLAIKGENFDGSEFVGEALSGGATYAIVQSGDENHNTFLVDDVISFIGKICSQWMNDFDGNVIAVTGSNGKTTTKDLISHILSKKGYDVSKTEGNFNTSIGVPLSIFSFPHNASQVYVLELGANRLGDIEYLSSMVKPDIGVITNISDAHLEGFGSIENIIKEKKSILTHSKKGYYNEDISEPFRGLVNHPLGKNKVFLENASIACKVCEDFMLEEDLVKFDELLQDFTLPKGRGEVCLLSNNITLIDDAYNANPESVKAAIDNLQNYQTEGKKIFVFGDMKELGKDEVKFHEEIADYCEEKIDTIICYGDLAKNTFNGSKNIPLSLHFNSKEALSNKVCNLLEKNDIVLLKGSRSMGLDSVAEDIKNYVK